MIMYCYPQVFHLRHVLPGDLPSSCWFHFACSDFLKLGEVRQHGVVLWDLGNDVRLLLGRETSWDLHPSQNLGEWGPLVRIVCWSAGQWAPDLSRSVGGGYGWWQGSAGWQVPNPYRSFGGEGCWPAGMHPRGSLALPQQCLSCSERGGERERGWCYVPPLLLLPPGDIPGYRDATGDGSGKAHPLVTRLESPLLVSL